MSKLETRCSSTSFLLFFLHGSSTVVDTVQKNRDETGEAEQRHGAEHSGHYGSNLQLFYSS